MNETIRRFGYPETLVKEYAHWVVLLRPEQSTLGSLVLAARSEAESFADLPSAAFTELGPVIADIERNLRRHVDYAKINYLMLMMVDRHVHFHVLPRYDGSRTLASIEIADRGWPKAPVLGDAVQLDSGEITAISNLLKERWDRRD